MSEKERGKRDGTGSFFTSWQKANKKKGRRKLAGEKCPVEKEEN